MKIDPENKSVLVEPNVPMDKLVRATLKFGLVPPVVTEFPGITVGGAIQGGAIESGSWRWGAFSQTVKELEIILGNGEIVSASPTNKADLFYGTAGSYGSLGLITAAEIRLIPAKKYVIIRTTPVSNFREARDVSVACSKTDCDFIECGMFDAQHGCVAMGTFSNEIEGELLRLTRPQDPLYYMLAEKIAFSRQESIYTIPLWDYLFRYNRGAFWAAQKVFEQSGLPFNRLTRFLLDPMLRARKLYQAVQDSAAGQRYICQDIAVPYDSVIDFMRFIDKEFQMYPTGFCMVKPEPRSALQYNGIPSDRPLFSVGVYGMRLDSYEKFVAANRAIEAKTAELGGRKWLYAHSYYTLQEFWNIYDKKWYDRLRLKYHATTLPDIYERTRVKKQIEVHVRRAAMRTMLGRARLHIID